MAKPKSCRGNELLKLLLSFGYECRRITGSHHLMYREGSLPISVPVHAGKNMKYGTLRGIIKDAGLTVDEFNKLI